MKSFDKQTIFILILLLLTGAVTWGFFFRTYFQKDTVNIHAFPKTIGEWTSEELPITDHEYDILETRNAFTRKYTDPRGREVYLFIVYSQTNRKVSHPPEVCYAGSGAVFSQHASVLIPGTTPPATIRANKILVEFKDINQYMYYWFKVGNTFTSNYWKQQMLIALKTLLGKSSSSALIRLSATIQGENEAQASQAIEDFARLITPLLFQYLP